MTVDPAAIQISHYALDCPAGDEPRGLYAACDAGLPAYRANREYTAPDPTTGKPAPLMLGQLPEPEDTGTSAFNPERLLPRLQNLLAQLEGPLENARVLVCLPGPDQARRQRLEPLLLPWLQQQLAALGADRPATVADDTLPAQLEHAWQQLQQEQIAKLVLIGVDSLLNEETLHQRQENNDIRTATWAHGRVLSEAMALVVLEPSDAQAPSTPGHIHCSQLAMDREADDRGPDHRRMQAPARAGRQVLGGGDTLPRPDRVILTRAQSREDELTWYHTHIDLWPVRLSPRENLAMRKGELEAPQPELPEPLYLFRPALSLGDTGAASLTLALITACEALRYPLNPARDALVLDSPGGREHLALYLEHTLTTTHQPREGTHHEQYRD